jgi:hypothetical protein
VNGPRMRSGRFTSDGMRVGCVMAGHLRRGR